MVETAEVIISAHATGTSQVAALRTEIGKLDLSTIELNKQQQAFTRATLRQAEAMSGTKAEVAAMKAEQLGLTDTLGPVIGAMRDAELAAAVMGNGMAKGAHHAELGIKKMLTSGRSMREMIVLLHESLIMGNYSRFGGSLMVEAEQLDLSEHIFTAAFGIIAAGAVTVAGLTAAMVMGELQSARYASSMQMTGDVAGITEGQFNAMAESIGRQVPGGVILARNAMNDLIRTGQFTGATLKDVTRAAVEFARVSGEKADKVVSDFAKMGSGVAKWAAEANSKYHFLSLTQYEYIQTLEEQGHREQAERAVANDLYKSLGTDAPRNLGYLIEALHGVRNAAVGAWDALESIGRATTLSDQIAALKHQIADPGMMSRFGGGNTTALQAQLTALETEQAHNRAAAAAKGHYQQVQQSGIAAHETLLKMQTTLGHGPDLVTKNYNSVKTAISQSLAANPQDPLALQMQSQLPRIHAELVKKYGGTTATATHTTALHSHTTALLHDAAATKGAARANAEFDTLLRTQSATVQNQIAAMSAEAPTTKAAAQAHKLLAAELQNEAWARREIAKYPARAAQINAAMGDNAALLSATNITGAPAATPTAHMAKLVDASTSAAKDVQQVWKKTWSGLTDQLTTALEGGRVNFRSFTASIFKDMTGMVVQQAIVSPLSSGLGSLLKGIGGAGSIADMFSGGTKGGGGNAFSGSMGNIGWGGGQQPTMPSPTGGGSILGDALGAAKSGLGLVSTITGIGSLFSKGSALASAASDIGPVLGTIGKFFGFADGGIMTPMGPMPLHAYSNGGIASSPQVAMYGEGRMPEAYVPLPDGRSIPVSMKGGGGGNHTFNINTHVHGDGTVTGDPQNSAAGIHTAIRAAIQHEMIRQKRDGGLMAMNGTGYG